MSYTYKGKKPGWGYEPPKQSPTAPRKRAAEAVCGTNSGYMKHIRVGTETCGPCRAAHAAYMRTLRPPIKELKPCGTTAAYRRHLRNGEVADEACLAAHREYMKSIPSRSIA